MRPRRLELTALGSYGDTVVVDFDALAPYGLFHVHGPTGAGKSSLLDGLCFALFGTVAAPRRADGLRSHHAVGATEAVATLDFSCGDRDYRIVRTPTQWRAKKRGAGSTEQRTTAFLHRHDPVSGGFVPLASGVREVDDLVNALLGLTAEQFMQVVVLPQGGFQQALRAGAEERAQLLRTLFHTERFEQYSVRLDDRKRQLTEAVWSDRARLHDFALAIKRQVGLLEEVDRQWPDEQPGSTLGQVPIEEGVGSICAPALETLLNDDASLVGDSWQTALAECLHRAQNLMVTVEARQTVADEFLARAEGSVTVARLAAERWQRRIGAKRRVEDLRRNGLEIDDLRQELANADTVAPIVPLVRGAQHSSHRRSEFGALVEAALQLVGEISHEALGRHGPKASELRESSAQERLAHDLREASHCVREARARHQRLAKAEQAAAVATRRARQADESATRAASNVVQAAEHVETLAVRLDALRVVAGRCGDLRDVVDHQRATVLAGERLPGAQALFDDASKRSTKAEQQELALRRVHLQLLERRIAGMAAELAAALVDGDPCAVCGATEHPAPATFGAQISKEAVDRAQHSADEAAVVKQSAHTELDLARRSLEELRHQAGPAADDLLCAQQRLATVEAELAQSLEGERAAELAQATLVTARQDLDEARRASTDLGERAAVLQGHADAAAAERQRIQSEMATVGAEGDLDLQKQTIDRAIDALDELRQLLGAQREVASQAEHDAGVARKALRQHGCSNADEALAAERNDNHRRILRDQVTAYDRNLATALATLEEPAIAAAEPPELDVALAVATDARKHARIVQEHAAQTRHAVHELRRLIDRFEAEQQALRPRLAECDRVTQLADLCSGRKPNDKRMSLERYVLAAHLEEVANAAGERLRAMSSGRYHLRYSDSRVRGNGASGLTLLVADAHTGVEREVSSLSGGETFLASLALALGLADVVQQHAGGVHIEALFVDEGFGSLDAETLDLAMAELDRLRAGGRLVGVISHVPTLRERIPAGIEVIASPTGSTLRLVGVDPAA